MKYTFCLPAVLALALFTSGPIPAKEAQQAPAADSVHLNGQAIKGKVLETMNAGGYTYLQLDSNQGKVWVAVPETKVEKGKEVTASPGMVMTNFESKTLKKTFDTIIFSSGLAGSGSAMGTKNKSMMGGTGKADSFEAALMAESGAKSPHGSMGGAMGSGAAMAAQSGGSSVAIVPAAEVKIDKAAGENGQTVADCFNKAKELNNKTVQVRGKVMKISKMIMGKNWVHLQDGTGNPMNNTHDLVVTTMAEPAKNSIVVMEGTLHADKDFGAGYRYDAIIEDAVVK